MGEVKKLSNRRLIERLTTKETIASLLLNLHRVLPNFRPQEYLREDITNSFGTHYIGLYGVPNLTKEAKIEHLNFLAEKIASKPEGLHIWVANCMQRCLPVRYKENCMRITEKEDYGAICNSCDVGYLADRVNLLGANLKTIGSSPDFLQKEIIPSIGNIEVLITAACALATEQQMVTRSIGALNVKHALAYKIEGINTHTCTPEEWLAAEKGKSNRITRFHPGALEELLYVLDKAIDIKYDNV